MAKKFPTRVPFVTMEPRRQPIGWGIRKELPLMGKLLFLITVVTGPVMLFPSGAGFA